MKKINKTIDNNEKAITLISLVIMVIVLLILAGISISILSGNNSILNKAGQAKEDTKVAQDKEILKMCILSAQMSSNFEKNKTEEILKSLESTNAEDIAIRGNNISLKLNGKSYRIKPNGEVIEYEYLQKTDIYYKYDSNNNTLYLRNSSLYGHTKGTNWSTNENIDISQIKEITIEEPISPTSVSKWFNDFINLEKINEIKNLHLEIC